MKRKTERIESIILNETIPMPSNHLTKRKKALKKQISDTMMYV